MRCLGGGNPLNRTCVEGGYMQNKQGRTSGGGGGGGGEGVQNWKFQANVLFE